MTAKEICCICRKATRKQCAVTRLAKLNNCECSDIIEMLTLCGVIKESKPRPNMKRKRNLQIYNDWKLGTSQTNLALKYALSKVRISEIITTEKSLCNTDQSNTEG